jgi:Mn2+/Fe2+ NRAMP family transporter
LELGVSYKMFERYIAAAQSTRKSWHPASDPVSWNRYLILIKAYTAIEVVVVMAMVIYTFDVLNRSIHEKRAHVAHIGSLLGYLCRLEEEAGHFVLAAFLSFLLASGVLSRGAIVLAQEVRGPRERRAV